MVNVLVIENDKIKCKNIINTIYDVNNYYRISKIAYTGYEAILLVKKYKFDLIIIDEDLPDMSLHELFYDIIFQDEENYRKSIIILANSMNLFFNHKEKEYILDVFYDSINYDDFIGTLCYYRSK